MRIVPTIGKLIVAAMGYALIYVLLIKSIEYRASRRAQMQTETHSRHLSVHLWDMSTQSATAYMELIGRAENYRSIRIFHEDGELFAAWEAKVASASIRESDDWFAYRHDEPILHEDRRIGWLETVQHNQNLRTHGYLLAAFILVYVAHVMAWSAYRARSARKNAERDLEQSRKRLEAVVTGAPLMVFLIGRNGVFDMCLGRAMERLGWSPDRMRGRNADEMESEWPELRVDIERALRGETFTCQRRIGALMLEIRFSPSSSDGHAEGVIGVATDVTELESALEKLKARDNTIRGELALARDIQQWMIPAVPPILPGFEFGLLFKPSIELSGDVIHMIQPPDKPNLLRIIFADITGHGVAASLLSAMFRTIADDLFSKERPADECMSQLNRALARQFPEYHFASALFLEINARERTMTYVNASQEPLCLFRRNCEPRLLHVGGPAPGLIRTDPWPGYKTETLRLRPGDFLLLFTDGIVEIRNHEGNELGRDRLLAWSRECMDGPPQIILDRLWENATAFAGTAELADDVSAIAIRAL